MSENMSSWLTHCCAVVSVCRDALQHANVPPGARPGLGQARSDALLLARLLDVLHTANVQVRCLSACSCAAIRLDVFCHMQQC
jgi:hypothetical protein